MIRDRLKPKSKNTPMIIWVRRFVQLSFVALVLISATLHFTDKGNYPSVDTICPFGAVETLWTYMTTGQFLAKTALPNFVLAAGLLVGTFIVGGAFCGWICPLGTLQNFLNWLRQKLHLPTIKVPDNVDAVLTYGRYVVLAIIIYMSASTATLWFAAYDPYRTIFSLHWFFDFNIAEWFTYALAAAIVVGSLFIPRMWCRYLCPLGGLISVVQRISPIKIYRDEDLCIDCNLCNKACPMHLPVATSQSVGGSCIACLECVEHCPVKGALEIGWAKRNVAKESL